VVRASRTWQQAPSSVTLIVPSYTTLTASMASLDEHKAPMANVEQDPSLSELGGESNHVVSEKAGTSADVHDMARMGKRQETRRNFRQITILGFTMVVLSSWEAILATSVFALGNGGTAGLIWGYFIIFLGFGFVTASLAEMASM
jgi:choline transport protein